MLDSTRGFLLKQSSDFIVVACFDNQTFQKILRKEKIERFSFVLVSKTLHHLRTAKCIARKRDKNHKCREDEKDCIYGFEEEIIFPRLLELAKRVVIYECFAPDEKDEDKIRGRGGYFTTLEWKRMFDYLTRKYKVHFVKPENFNPTIQDSKRLESILRKVDTLCFYVEV